eukprot:3220907-Rhodomonas_salina.1
MNRSKILSEAFICKTLLLVHEAQRSGCSGMLLARPAEHDLDNGLRAQQVWLPRVVVHLRASDCG